MTIFFLTITFWSKIYKQINCIKNSIQSYEVALLLNINGVTP